jgi:radical SAM superfamily enzyme YgiQ (UPF0313 family)
MKILLLNPTYGIDFCKSARWAAKSRGRVQRHPDWMCIATAVLEQAGHECLFIDAQAKNMPMQNMLKKAEQFAPDMSVIWTTTPSIYNDIAYAEILKEKTTCETVLVGAHPTALPEQTLNIKPGAVDAIAIGEFDYTLRDLADEKPMLKIKGLAYWQNFKFYQNPPRPRIKNLDDLPFPAWHHINPKDYWDGGKLYPFLTMITGRGCIGACTFCREKHNMHPGNFTNRSPEKSIDEIEHDLKLFPYLKEIMIENDTFTSDLEYVKEFCKEKLNRKKTAKIKWSCNARADITDFSVLKLMKKSGCRMLCVGYEFGSQGLLDKVGKGITLKQMKLFTRMAKKAGLKINGCFMIGAPGETIETAKRTIKFAKELNPNTAQFSVMVPYPGTPFYKWAKTNNYIIAKNWTDWVNENLEQATVLSYPKLSKKDMEALVDRGLKEFYKRPEKIIELGLEIRSLSDLKRKVHGLKAYMNYFTQKPTNRL